MIFFECTSPDCQMRFPAGEGDPQAVICPRCGSRTTPGDKAIKTNPQVINPALSPSLHLELLLDNIRSIYNVGSIFRTADGAGVRHLHLGGISATPEHPKVAKTALGAAEHLPWTYWPSGVQAAERLHKNGFVLWALENISEAVPLHDVTGSQIPSKLVVVVGNEVAGIDPAIIDRCQKAIALPMMGLKESLNVTIACGAAVYHLLFSNKIPD